jgi:hypothetical protein
MIPARWEPHTYMSMSKKQYVEVLAGHIFARSTIPAFPIREAPQRRIYACNTRGVISHEWMSLTLARQLGQPTSWGLSPVDVTLLMASYEDPADAADAVIDGAYITSGARAMMSRRNKVSRG